MLNQETRNLLKQVTKIGNSGILRYPLSAVTNTDKTIIAFLDMSQYEQEFPEFGLMYLNEFLSLVEFYQNPDVTMNGSTITIKGDDGVQNYQTTDVDMLNTVNVPPQLLEKMEGTPASCKLEITAADLDRAKKISSLAKSDSLVMGCGDSPEIVVCRVDDARNIVNDSSISVMGEGSCDVRIELNMANVDKLPPYDYTVSLIQNDKTKNFVTIWEAKSAPLKVAITVKQTL